MPPPRKVYCDDCADHGWHEQRELESECCGAMGFADDGTWIACGEAGCIGPQTEYVTKTIRCHCPTVIRITLRAR